MEDEEDGSPNRPAHEPSPDEPSPAPAGGGEPDGPPIDGGAGPGEAGGGAPAGEPQSEPAPQPEPEPGPESQPERRRSGRDWGPWPARIRVALFALAGAVIALALAGRVTAKVGPFDTTVAARPSWSGETVLRLAPLGTIGLDTHDWPLGLELRVDELGVDEAERIAENPALVDNLGDDLAAEVQTALWHLAVRCALVGLAGGLAGALVARLSWRSAVAGVTTGALVVGGVGTGTALTFNAEAVAEPRYSGLLTVAPRAVGDVESIVARFGEYRAQLGDLVTNLVTLYLAAEGLPTFEPTDGMVRLLHVSDIHLNPTAFTLIEQITDQFGIQAVVDTGDITDWGTATEGAVVDQIGDLDVPYVWVRGNHDSRSTQAAVDDQPNAVVLDGEATDVAGLRLWGIGDPRYTPNKEELGETESEQERAESFAPRAAESLAEAEPPEVDVALVHDPRLAADLGGEVPLVLAGHTHDARERSLDDDTLLLVEGSTGGAGLRGLQGEEPEPLTATVLYFDPDSRRLVAYDRITVQGVGETGVTIDRRVLPESEEHPAIEGDTAGETGPGDDGEDGAGGGEDGDGEDGAGGGEDGAGEGADAQADTGTGGGQGDGEDGDGEDGDGDGVG